MKRPTRVTAWIAAGHELGRGHVGWFWCMERNLKTSISSLLKP